MRGLVVILVGLVIAIIVGFLGTVLIDAIPHIPAWVDTVWWVLVILGFILWAVGFYGPRRAPL